MKKFLFIAAVLTVCGAAQAAKEKEATKIKIGRMALVMCHSPALLLDRQNLLEDAGIKDYELKYFTKGSLSSKALAAKETDMAFFGAIIPAIANGLQARIVAINSMGGTQLVCTKDSKVKSLKDLKGMRVGTIGPTASPTSILTVALDKAGILKDVELQHINRQNVAIAMTEQKVVECAAVLEPLTSEMVKRGARVVLDEKQLYNDGDYPFTFVVARQDFIKNHRDEVKKVIDAHLKAQDLLTSKPETVYPALNKYFEENGIKIAKKDFQAAMSTNIFKATISRKVMNELIAVMAKSGIIDKDKKFEDFVDCSFGTCVD